ncbi:MAG: division/cell wall cluster transcriptional repressor MraZ [Candidatus Subteraquimicrobiales bacterium]|nr:division/cell wall cluster transcriptional repressor MraZ [Candidatus Subteraquimicrobiales bacterium]
MFCGEYQHSIDEKGRLILPSKLRDALADGLVVAKGLEGCLFIFSKSEWLRLEDKVRTLPLTKRDARKFSRFLFGGATEEVLDKQGRVLIPEHLREYASFKKDVVVVGVSSRLEVWAKEKWDAYSSEAAESYEDIAEELDLGL